MVEQLEVSQRFHQDLCELRELLAQRYISLEGFVIEDYLEDEMPLDIIIDGIVLSRSYRRLPKPLAHLPVIGPSPWSMLAGCPCQPTL